MPVPPWVSDRIYPLVWLAFGLAPVFLLLAFKRGWLLDRVHRITRRLLPAFHEAITGRLRMALTSLDVLRNRRDNLKILGWTGAIWFTAALVNYVVIRALQIDAPAVSALFVLLVLQLSVSLPAVPSAIGVFEYLCALSLAVFAVDRTLGVSFGFLLHALVLLPHLAGLLLFWMSGLSVVQLSRRTGTAPDT